MHRRLLSASLAGMLLIVISLSAFVATRRFTADEPARAADPPVTPVAADTTPPADATPDRSKPLWYVPYLNADRDKPVFQGEIGGISIRPVDSSTPIENDGGACPPGTRELRVLTGEEADRSIAGTGLATNKSSLRGLLTPLGSAQVMECDGTVRNSRQFFEVPAGLKGVNPGGGSVQVLRYTTGNQVWVPAPADRWSEIRVGGKPAAGLRPVIDTVGDAGVILRNQDGLTVIRGSAVTIEFLISVAEELVQ